MEETKVNQTTVPNEEQVAEVVATSNDSFKQIIKNLMSTGACRRFNNIRIKNVNTEELDNYCRVSFTLADKIPARVSKDEGLTFEDGERNVIFTSTYALAGSLKENEDLAWIANPLRENPKAIGVIMTGGSIDILQQRVAEGEKYHNPFTTKEEVEDTVFDHDTIINYIVGVNLGKTGQKFADMLAVKMMGF